MNAPSLSVAAWSCAICGSLHAEQSDADACCQCSSRGEKFKHDRSYGSVCEACEYGASLRTARADVERHADNWRHAQTRLQKLYDNPPPTKKRPKTPLSKAATEEVPETPYVRSDGVVDGSAWAPLHEVEDWLIDLADKIDLAPNGTDNPLAREALRMAAKLTRAIPKLGGGRTP